MLSRAGDPACRLVERHGSIEIHGQAKAMVVKSGPGLGGGVAAPSKDHFVIRYSAFDIRNSLLFLHEVPIEVKL
jgi:hypothetical protein